MDAAGSGGGAEFSSSSLGGRAGGAPFLTGTGWGAVPSLCGATFSSLVGRGGLSVCLTTGGPFCFGAASCRFWAAEGWEARPGNGGGAVSLGTSGIIGKGRCFMELGRSADGTLLSLGLCCVGRSGSPGRDGRGLRLFSGRGAGDSHCVIFVAGLW